MGKKMSVHELLVPTFTQMLRSMDGWLGKAEAHGMATDAGIDSLLSIRLAPDMYPLSAQIRFACFQAQEPLYRLREAALPDGLLAMRQQGWNAGAEPGTWAQARACVSDALTCLETVAAGALNDHAGRTITLNLPNGMIFDMTPAGYARDWCLPQFYFHLAMAYAILRQHGVPLGKADYVAHMLGYLRPGIASPG